MDPQATPLQRKILAFIAESIAERGFPPTVREIGLRLRIASPGSVAFHLKALERAGLLARSRSRSRGLVPVEGPFRLPILGRAGAGPGPIAQEDVEGWLGIDRAASRGAHFMLRVRGESMTDAGILDGDLALVRRQESADDGDIVAALVGEDGVIKRLRRGARGWFLSSARSGYQPITGEFSVMGKVVGILRHYEP
ncbi:MAG: repressor LexA [Elusimicrobia bacterium]|nr:repressor LexA [Elusimicrobiota bacterium]